jgi:hypothetical protein
MARSSIALRTAVVTVALVAVATLSACSATPTPAHSAKAQTTTTPTVLTPTPTPTPTFSAQKYTCNSILPPATLAVFKSKASAGFTLQKDYQQRMQNIASNLVAFDSYGGILCQWAYPDSSSSVAYAFSPIPPAQTSTQQQALTANGYVATEKDHGMLFANTDVADYPDEYLFIDGYWMQGSSDSVMQQLVDNVFVTPTD